MSPDAAPAAGTLVPLVEAWLAQRPPSEGSGGPIEIVRAERLAPGRPGLLDVVADVGGGPSRLAHLVIGLRSVGDEPHFLVAGEEAVLGLLEDGEGLAVGVDALRDAQLGPLALATVRRVPPRPGSVGVVREDAEATVLDCGDRGDLTVYHSVGAAPRPEVDLLMALEETGFNHVAAPLVRWVWGQRDLGVVQEPLSNRSSGWALALTSLRDLYAAGGPPETAGGDFGPEAHALGTMTARLHLSLDRAFGRQSEPVRDWVEAGEKALRDTDPSLLDAPGVPELLAGLRTSEARAPAIRTHGDLHLGRTARTDQGWMVADCAPGGVLPGEAAPRPRSPLGDVADLLWSLHQATLAAAAERDPTGRLGLTALGQAWETRNRRALFAGYLGTPGILGLHGSDRDTGRQLVAFFELARSARPAAS